MAEPQPTAVHEGAADPHAPTSTAEDRKAVAALSALDALESENGAKKEIDGKALDKAMKGLNVKDKKDGDKKNVKVEAADVTLLVRLIYRYCGGSLGSAGRLWLWCWIDGLTRTIRWQSSRYQNRKLRSCFVRTTVMRSRP